LELKGLDVRHINKIVDLFNYISIKHTIPAGGDDLAKVDGDITLKFAVGEEPFTALNSQERETAKEGEIVYADSKEVLCRRWNWRECDKTKMTEETKDVILVVEALPPVTREELDEVVEDLSRLITEYCGGEIRTDILDEGKREIEI
jgi:lysyl-tRNA synthetase class 2